MSVATAQDPNNLVALNPQVDVHPDLDLSLATHSDVQGLAGRKKLQNAGPDNVGVERKAGENWMDAARREVATYEYLCHVGEAKEWIEACIQESIMPITEMDEGLRNGVVLAKLGRYFEPAAVRKIFEAPNLQWRHSDNITYFLNACRAANFPEIFYFEMTDLYDRKNIPKVIYCVHALSFFLAKQGRAPHIKNLIGQLEFTDAEINAAKEGLDASGVVIPHFGGIGNALAKEMKEEGPTEEELQAIAAKKVEEERLRVEEENRRLEEERLAEEQRLRDEAERRAREREAYIVANESAVIKLQSCLRSIAAQKRYRAEQQKFLSQEPAFIQLQSFARGKQARNRYIVMQKEHAALELITNKLQCFARGALARRSHNEIIAHYTANQHLVSKIQARYKAKQAKTTYEAISTAEETPVTALQSFIHLLDDSDKDFTEELELEALRQQVIKQIRDNTTQEASLNDMDLKIALLVKNRITLDEVVRSTKKKTKETEESAQSPAMILKALDKESRNKLQCYQQLFYLLQTEPKYLTQLILQMKRAKLSGFVETMILTLFGYAQNNREEFLLLRLFKCAITNEVEQLSDVNEFLKGNPVFIRLGVHYNRGAKERAFLRNLLQPLVKSVLEDDKLDLDTDPLNIYRNLIRAEESKTGQRSSRPFDISKEDALAQEDVKQAFVERLKMLGDITSKFLTAIIASLKSLPYGLRYISGELVAALKLKFPSESPEKFQKIVGHLIYYRYMNPAIVAPEGFDVIETLVNPLQRKNLAEVSRVLQQIAANRQFEDDQIYLQPLNTFVAHSSKQFLKFCDMAATVENLETHFSIDEYTDLSRTAKPVVYLSPTEIFVAHSLVAEHLETIAPDPQDPIREILQELGTPPPGFGSDMENINKAPGTEMSLMLTSRLKPKQDSEAHVRNLFMETKRHILTIIRVQTGKNLLDILEKPASAKEEATYQALRALEESIPSDTNTETASVAGRSTTNLATSMNFSQLKQHTLESMAELEKSGKVNKSNNYQDMLNAIAKDIRNKHRRRISRKTELRNTKQTFESLIHKAAYLDDQKKSYNDYINACIAQLSIKKGSKQAKPAMFSKQWSHVRSLQKAGNVPKFGSYKYGADKLYEKGILLSIEGYSPKQFDKVSLTVSSDEAGIFEIQVLLLGIKTPYTMELKLDDLLQAQFENVQTMELFGGIAKVNVNLLVFMINKKFFS